MHFGYDCQLGLELQAHRIGPNTSHLQTAHGSVRLQNLKSACQLDQGPCPPRWTYNLTPLTNKSQASTVEPRLSGPRLSGFFDYPDFFSGPNLVMNIYWSRSRSVAMSFLKLQH